MSRDIIRQFIEAVEWVTPSNISYLFFGKYNSRLYRKCEKELASMTMTTRVPALRKLYDQNGNVVYASPNTKKSSIGSSFFVHNRRLRDCLARYLYDRNHRWLGDTFIGKSADARIGSLLWEFDNGHMNADQLEEKIRMNYAGRGIYRVVFIMAHEYNNKDREKDRLYMLFQIVRRILPHKKNRILGNSYSLFLETGKLHNWRGEEKNI
jgi:hypothetical protein